MGGVAALLLVSAVAERPESAEALALARGIMRWVDWILIVPACLGSLGTGFLFAWRTSWGFFRHTWLSIKWALTVTMILFGIFFLGPWVDHTAALAMALGPKALEDGAYSATAALVFYFGVLQMALLVSMLFLSTFKPHRRRGDV